MGSDRARVSYDPSRHYRGVVHQQGRVTLEADWNEAETIAAEENREQLLDIVGPSGTPDDGYRVVPVVNSNGNATGGLTVSAGTLYVGGERMVLDADLDYGDQPDWVDREGDPLWAAPAVPQGTANESVYLLLREQEVGAVEDTALLDVALGGPDTTQRRRIVQRVVRGSTDGPACADGLAWLEGFWGRRGLTFDPDTMQLRSGATLQVGFQQDPTAATPCDPVAQGGYLGAENQLIRVQVASVDEKGAPTLVWGFDDAYFLYRVTVGAVDTGAGTTVLTLAAAPVDQYHQPQRGQAVEVLEAAAKLTADDYVAATTGIVTTVGTAYQPDTQEVVIDTALAAPTTDSPLLFLRVWQDTIPSYAGGAVALASTGVTVTLTSTGVYNPGDYWMFSVRPGTPTTVSPVYPQRILDAPQPPEGPRMWLCPLGVVAWADGGATVTDCRTHLCTLADACGDGTCCIDVTPESVDGGAGLQAVIDRYAGKGPVRISLAPGTYTLPKPLVITGDYRGLILEGCGRGVILQAAQGPPRSFLLGLILLEDVTGFTLRHIELRLPQVPLQPSADAVKSAVAALPTERQALLLRYIRALDVSIGVYVLAARDVVIEECTFVSTASEAEIFGAAIFAARGVDGLKLLYNAFFAPEQDTVPFASLTAQREADSALQLLVGYLQLPTRTQTVSLRELAGTVVVKEAPAQRVATQRVRARAAETQAALSTIGLPALADGIVEGNLFDGLTVPMIVLGRVGTVRIEENTVRACYGGFWIVHTASTLALSLIERTSSATGAASEYINNTGLAALGDPVFLLASVVARILPVTPNEQDPAGTLGVLKAPSRRVLEAAGTLFQRIYTAAAEDVAPEPTPEPSPAPGPASKEGAVKIAYPKELTALYHSAASVSKAGELVAADPGTALEPRLEVTANQIDAVIASSDSGVGLLVLVADTEHDNSIVCSHNRIRSRVASGATVALWDVLQCALTGNIVTNESGGEIDRSVFLLPRVPRKVPAVAVTGNVLIGPARLPVRPDQAAPFNTWNGLNTLMTVTS
ncbi:MAG TPA: DUF6519 domain-containing protein [Gaiellaceae bacterium]|jgi:hypothetical protein